MNYSGAIRLSAVAAFIAVTGLPLFLLPVRPANDVRATERRDAALRPAVPRTWAAFNAWPRIAEKYLDDHFHGRSQLIRWNSRARYAMGDSSAVKVLVGRAGWLFLERDGPINDRFRGAISFSPAQLAAWFDRWQERALICRSEGASLVVAVAPDKQSIYPDMMPSGYHRVGRNLSDQLFERAGSALSFPMIDLRPLLRESRTNIPTFRRYDTHWTDEGMALAYHAIMDAVQPLIPARRIQPPAYAFHPATISGDLAGMLKLAGLVETLPVIGLNADALSVASQPDFEATAANGWRIASGQPGHARVLVLCDSYVMATPMIALLANSFTETWFLHHYACKFPRAAVEEFRPDMILYIVAERLIPLEFAESDNR